MLYKPLNEKYQNYQIKCKKLICILASFGLKLVKERWLENFNNKYCINILLEVCLKQSKYLLEVLQKSIFHFKSTPDYQQNIIDTPGLTSFRIRRSFAQVLKNQIFRHAFDFGGVWDIINLNVIKTLSWFWRHGRETLQNKNMP